MEEFNIPSAQVFLLAPMNDLSPPPLFAVLGGMVLLTHPWANGGTFERHLGRGLVSEIQPLISRCSLHNQIFGRDLPPFIWPTSRLCSLVHSLLRAFQIQNNIHGLFQSSPEWSKPTSPHATLQAGTIVVVCFVLLRIRNDPVSLYHIPSLIFHYWRSKKTERQATLDCKTSCSQ